MKADADDLDRRALEAFVVDNPDLERLEALLDCFNIFEAIGMVRQELRHSYFLSFLLDPRGNHGLGEAFIKRLLQRVLATARDVSVPVTPLELELWDMNELSVHREWRHIDILLLDEAHRLAVIIENKLGSGERSGQLSRYLEIVERNYPGWKIIGVYLTPSGERPSHRSYVPVSYGLICDVIDGVAYSKASAVSQDLKILMVHYSDMLRRNIVGNSEIARLSRQIYKKHHRALALIYEHGPDHCKRIHKLLRRLIREAPRLIYNWHGTEYPEDYMVFDIEDWKVPALAVHNAEGDLSSAVYWVFWNHPEGVDVYLELASGDNDVRHRLFDIARKNRAVFKDVPASLTSEETMLFSRPLLTPEFYENATYEECEGEIRKRWAEFLEQDLPRIDAALKAQEWIWEPSGSA